MEQFGSALDAFREALAIRKQLVRDDPNNALYGDTLASSYVNIGDVEMISKKWGDAIESYQSAVSILQELWNKDRANSERKTRLDRAQEKIGAARTNAAKVPLQPAEN